MLVIKSDYFDISHSPNLNSDFLTCPTDDPIISYKLIFPRPASSSGSYTVLSYHVFFVSFNLEKFLSLCLLGKFFNRRQSNTLCLVL